MVLPYVKRILLRKYRDYKNITSQRRVRQRKYSEATNILLIDHQDEVPFLARIRDEAEADVYKVQDDILEMCVQFGYLTLFAVAWPLVPLGFLLNNWLELRGDFFKISVECQRPLPIRADSIGPWLDVLSFLSWLGTLSTAAIVHLYRSGSTENVELWSLLLTLLVTEQVYLAVRFLVRTSLEKLGSDAVRREEARKYEVRKRYLETFSEEASEISKRHKPRVRFNETTDVAISPTKTTFDGEDKKFDLASYQRTNGKLKEEAADDLDDGQEHPDAPFKGGLSRTDSGSLLDHERSMRFWSWHKTHEERVEAGVKLIKVLASLQQSKKSRSERLKRE
jgi:hypothetical protein